MLLVLFGFVVNCILYTILAEERTDHSILDSNMHIVWALGQKHGSYAHTPNSGLEAQGLSPSDPNYYKLDELKYHGGPGSNQRGSLSLNFHGENKNYFCKVQLMSHDKISVSYTNSVYFKVEMLKMWVIRCI